MAAVVGALSDNVDYGNGGAGNCDEMLASLMPSTPGSLASTATSSLRQDIVDEAKRKQQVSAKFTDEQGTSFIEHAPFKATVGTLVLLNAITMGIQVDYPDDSGVWRALDLIFAALFTVEMCLKLVILRLQYFRDYWNWFDFVLTWVGVFDICVWIANEFFDGGSSLNLSRFAVLRTLRLLRIVRLARLFRQCQKLVIVMQSIFEAIESTLWVSAVLVCCLYMCSILCVELIGHAPANTYPGYSEVTEEIDDQEFMQNFNPYIKFGNVGSSMLTLLNIAILAEWVEVVQPIMVKQPFLVFFFIAFCNFVCFGVMNVIIGMIVDSVIKNSRDMERELDNARIEAKLSMLEELQSLIFTLDEDGNEEMDINEVQRAFAENGEKVRNTLRDIHLPFGCTPQEFFTILDNDGDGHLQSDEFIKTIYRLMNCGPFQMSCLVQMGVNDLKRMVIQLRQEVESRFDAINVSGCKEFASPISPTSGSSDKIKSSLVESNSNIQKCFDAGALISIDSICEKIAIAVQQKVQEELREQLEASSIQDYLRPKTDDDLKHTPTEGAPVISECSTTQSELKEQLSFNQGLTQGEMAKQLPNNPSCIRNGFFNGIEEIPDPPQQSLNVPVPPDPADQLTVSDLH